MPDCESSWPIVLWAFLIFILLGGFGYGYTCYSSRRNSCRHHHKKDDGENIAVLAHTKKTTRSTRATRSSSNPNLVHTLTMNQKKMSGKRPCTNDVTKPANGHIEKDPKLLLAFGYKNPFQKTKTAAQTTQVTPPVHEKQYATSTCPGPLSRRLC